MVISRGLLVLVFTFRFMIHFNLVSVYGMRSGFTLFHRDIQLFSAFWYKDVSLVELITLAALLKISRLYVFGLFLESVLFHSSVFTLRLIRHFILITVSRSQSGNQVVQVFPLGLSS